MFNLTEEHEAVREAARQFAQNDLKPGVIERDTKMQYPREQVRKMAELGFLGMMVPHPNTAAAAWILSPTLLLWRKSAR
jgi:alkylation response protein AidB-like acyl-CoA dehydrogenase